MRKKSVFLILLAVVASGATGVAAGYALYWLHGVTTGTAESPAAHESPTSRGRSETYEPDAGAVMETDAADGFPSETGDEWSPVTPSRQAGDIPQQGSTLPYGADSNRRQSVTSIPLNEPAPHQYVLSLFDGYVAVFSALDGDFDRVMEVTATPVAALSVDERKRLSAGIKILDDEQLAKILQDYGS